MPTNLLITEVVEQLIQTQALSVTHQTIITYLLKASENIFENSTCSEVCICEFVIKLAINLLERCLNQKCGDSNLKQRFLG